MAADHGEDSNRLKLGLALSGGGFRASFFHIGVLARMAELGLLRNVEVLSAVSGGSIIGAMYYLRLKELLERKNDEDITDQDYIDLITDMIPDFMRGVQRNIRCRTLFNFFKIMRMVLPNYSRSDRIGELYDEEFYQKKRPGFLEKIKTSLGLQSPHYITLSTLKINPPSQDNFSPTTDNAKRRAKVPILILNSTELNTGHNWRFEASRMGEDPLDSPTLLSIDKHLRHQRPSSYSDLPSTLPDMELGLAVAASACVPVLFHPLSISGMYKDIRLQLVDGGVHDNQGVDALFDKQCSHVIVSDASGQMVDENNPSTSILSVFSRTNSILQERLREVQLTHCASVLGDKAAIMHLRTGLDVQVAPHLLKNKQAAQISPLASPVTAAQTQVDPKVQTLLSRIRTDLDSFSEIEAHALMMDGYLVSLPEIKRTRLIKDYAPPYPLQPLPSANTWPFETMGKFLANPTPNALKHLDAAKKRCGKAFYLYPWLLLPCVLLLLVLAAFIPYSAITAMHVSSIAIALLCVVVLASGKLEDFSGIKEREALLATVCAAKEVVVILITLLLPIFMWIHVYTIDRFFISNARVRNL